MLDYIRYNLLFQLSLFSLTLLGLFSVLFLFLFVVSSLKASKEHASVPTSLPWVGTQDQLFSSIRANFRGLVSSVKLFTSGYRKVSLVFWI